MSAPGASLQDYALTAYDAGLCVVPPKQDGSKAPAGEWRRYQSRRPTRNQVSAWYEDPDTTGIGYICGGVSGGLEVLDFDDEAAWSEYQTLIADHDLDAPWKRLTDGYLERTPEGGYHVFWRTDVPEGNTKLAGRPVDGGKVDVLIETRGEGGWVVAAPSSGRVHPSGGAYTLLAGGVASIATVSADDRENLFALARMLDETEREPFTVPMSKAGTDDRPGDRYNNETTWDELLPLHGWTYLYRRGEVAYWRRPGKREGLSATTNHRGSDRLYVFTSSTVLQAERSYDRFGFYVVMEHGGHFSAAAKALSAEYRAMGRPIGGAPIIAFNGAASESHGEEEWTTPEPLPEGERPAFPAHLLPYPLSEYVSKLATATQTPPAMAALMALSVVAAAAAKCVHVDVRSGWIEPVNLYTLVSLPSGNRKSAVVSAVGKPLSAFERDESERMKIEIKLSTSRRTIAERKLDNLQKQLSRANVSGDDALALQGDADTLIRQLETDPSLRVPVAPRLLVDDITPEKLADIMAEQGGRLAVLSAEGGIFQTISGRYSEKSADALDLFLKGHAGDDMPIDRIGRETKHLTAPALTLALSVQPDVLAGLAGQPGYRGKGLLARFLYASPVSTVGSRAIDPDPVPHDVEAAYARLIADILALPVNNAALSLDRSAGEAFLTFVAQIEPRLGEGGDLEHLADWGAKLAGEVVRIAGNFHVVTTVSRGMLPWDELISHETIAAAIDIAETFLVPHAKTAFAVMGADPALDQARRVLRAIASWPEPSFSVRELHQAKLKAAFPKVAQLLAPLAILEEYGYIRPLSNERAGPGRKPSPRYEINPGLRAQNPHNPQNRETSGNSEDSEDFERLSA
jgi:replicative DNA helicase